MKQGGFRMLKVALFIAKNAFRSRTGAEPAGGLDGRNGYKIQQDAGF